MDQSGIFEILNLNFGANWQEFKRKLGPNWKIWENWGQFWNVESSKSLVKPPIKSRQSPSFPLFLPPDSGAAMWQLFFLFFLMFFLFFPSSYLSLLPYLWVVSDQTLPTATVDTHRTGMFPSSQYHPISCPRHQHAEMATEGGT